MISPRPTSLAGQVLARLVALGEADVERLTDDLYPRPRLLDSRAYPTWRLAVVEWEADRAGRRVGVSSILGRLQSAGYVERQGPPRIATGVPDPMTAAWLQRVRAGARIEALLDGADDYDPGATSAPFPGSVALDIVARIRAGAATMSEAVGTSGHAWEVAAELCALDVVVSPSVRRATARGVEVVWGWAA